MTESSLDRKLKRVQREIEEAKRRGAPLTPAELEKQRHEPPQPAEQQPCGHCGQQDGECWIWGCW